ncbi:MAG: hypothetical protein IPO87_16840, partial [Flavobacteriales bacterium]|nr:hypothetical protein [Flavobacteriales bacterium]
MSSAALGGSNYFTQLIGSGVCGPTATAFIWAGDLAGVNTLSITGNLGADGGGSQNTST